MNGALCQRTLSRLRAQLAELGVKVDVGTFSPGERDERAAVTLARGAFRRPTASSMETTRG